MPDVAEPDRPPLITVTTKKSPITSVTTKTRAERDAGLRERQHDVPDHAPAASRRASTRRLEQRRVDARHRIEDRHDHEQREEVDIGDDHRKIGEEQPFERLVDDARASSSALN